ncbi:Hypothetical predicted protein, partial [Paramuricea clavata]
SDRLLGKVLERCVSERLRGTLQETLSLTNCKILFVNSVVPNSSDTITFRGSFMSNSCNLIYLEDAVTAITRRLSWIGFACSFEHHQQYWMSSGLQECSHNKLCNTVHAPYSSCDGDSSLSTSTDSSVERRSNQKKVMTIENHLSSWVSAINGNKSVHAVVLDFAKAFDKVPRQRLLEKLWLFTDDVLVYGVIVGDAECDQLQNDLIKLEQWQLKWQMEFNPTKCKVIRISTKKSEREIYMFCSKQLEQVTSISYLGLTVTDKLRWSDHISEISNKAGKTLGMIKQIFGFVQRM